MIRYLPYIKIALQGLTAVRRAIVEAEADGEITTDEKIGIALAFFMALFATIEIKED